MIEKIFWTVAAGRLFYFGWKIGEKVYPSIEETVKTVWDEANKEGNNKNTSI